MWKVKIYFSNGKNILRIEILLIYDKLGINTVQIILIPAIFSDYLINLSFNVLSLHDSLHLALLTVEID